VFTIPAVGDLDGKIIGVAPVLFGGVGLTAADRVYYSVAGSDTDGGIVFGRHPDDDGDVADAEPLYLDKLLAVGFVVLEPEEFANLRTLLPAEKKEAVH